jgi:hypothetical protein
MGLGRYLRRNIAGPIAQRLDVQTSLMVEKHVLDLVRSPPYNAPKRLEPHGFRSFSQNDEDGIVQEIFRRIGTESRAFVEFGVGNGMENNSRALLYAGWRGLWIEGNPKACAGIRRAFSQEMSRGQLQLTSAFITRDNISGLIEAARLPDLDLLSIDIDGNDYWIWQAISLRPRVVIIEYNATFRPPTSWTIQYNESHRWNGSHYHGASLQALHDLGRSKGYTLVGCSLSGVNAFFVRDDLVNGKFAAADVAELYNPPRYYLLRLPIGHPHGDFGPYASGG